MTMPTQEPILGGAPNSTSAPDPNLLSQYNVQPQVTPRYYTEADLERARAQEKEKLYDRLNKQQEMLNTFKTTVDELKAEKDARAAQVAEQQKAADEAKRRADEEKLSYQELVAKREAELNKQLEQQRIEMENNMALWQKEQHFLQLGAYTQRRVAEEVAAGNIIPDLAEYITGENEEQVEAAITKAKEKTDSIVKGAQTLTAPVPPGVSPTGVPGIMAIPPGQRQYTRDDIANMSMAEYANYRRQQGMDRRGNGQGMFS